MTIQTIYDSISYLSEDEELLLRAAKTAALRLRTIIKDEQFAETDKAKNLAEAYARYFFRLLSFDASTSAKVGDITIRSDERKLLDVEEKLLESAIESAADILKDGEFFFEAS